MARGVHVLIFAESTREFLLQKRAASTGPSLWDISTVGHVSAADSSLVTARREVQRQLGISLPKDAFELLLVFQQESVTNEVYLVTIIDPVPLQALTLQDQKVSAVKYIGYEEYRSLLGQAHLDCAAYDVNGKYGQIFDIITQRYKDNTVERSLTLKKQLARYAAVTLSAELSGLSDEDRSALRYIIEAAKYMDEILYNQLWYSNPLLRDWLKDHADASDLDKLKWQYYAINKCPWSILDEKRAFLTTSDSAIKFLPEATKPVSGWKGLEYKAAFPQIMPPSANFYPPDMDKKEFELWKNSLPQDQQDDATNFFTVIKRHSELNSDWSNDNAFDLYSLPYSKEYKAHLMKAAELLHKAGDLASTPSLKTFLHKKADAFLSNDYYESDIAWLDLDSKLDITIGPYETYEDGLFGYKATFEAFIGVRDDKATSQLKLFGDNLPVLEQNLPMDDAFKSKEVNVAPIRVINVIYNAGDVKGTQPVAFNLPNDERIVKDRGTAMVMIKNVSEAKFEYILQPISEVCISKEQKELVQFDCFFTFAICHECVHGIGPHTITLPNGEKSTVRKELQELHSTLEEAKADIVGLWALRFFINKNLLPKSMLQSIYVSFLAGCFRSTRFGLKKAHGKGQAIQFNWLLEKEAFIMHDDVTFSVDFSKVEEAVESLGREILTIQAKGDKAAASKLLQKYCNISGPLKLALQKLENVQVPVDIAATFPVASEIAKLI